MGIAPISSGFAFRSKINNFAKEQSHEKEYDF